MLRLVPVRSIFSISKSRLLSRLERSTNGPSALRFTLDAGSTIHIERQDAADQDRIVAGAALEASVPPFADHRVIVGATEQRQCARIARALPSLGAGRSGCGSR